jgi:hypothetical protein
MGYIIWIVFVLSFIVLDMCLLLPIVNRGMSWNEAGRVSSRVHWRHFLLCVQGFVAYTTNNRLEENKSRQNFSSEIFLCS